MKLTLILCVLLIGYVLYLESEIKRLTSENKQIKTNKTAKKPPLVPLTRDKKKTNPPLPNGLKTVLGNC